MPTQDCAGDATANRGGPPLWSLQKVGSSGSALVQAIA